VSEPQSETGVAPRLAAPLALACPGPGPGPELGWALARPSHEAGRGEGTPGDEKGGEVPGGASEARFRVAARGARIVRGSFLWSLLSCSSFTPVPRPPHLPCTFTSASAAHLPSQEPLPLPFGISTRQAGEGLPPQSVVLVPVWLLSLCEVLRGHLL